MQSLNSKKVVFAGFGVRLAAYIIDLIIVGIILLVIKLPFFIIKMSAGDIFLTVPVVYNFSVYDIILYIALKMYFILMTYFTGSTLGKKLFRIKVIASDARKLSLWTVIFRETIGRYLSMIIIYIGYVMMLPDKEKRTLCDHLSDTRVIYSDVVPVDYVKSIM